MAWRKIELARGLFGLALLVAPRPMLRHVHRVEVDPVSVVVARVLGVRQLTQAALSGVRPSPEVLAMGVWVDLAHATSALGLAAVDSSRVFAGLLNAVAATGWAGSGYAALRTGPVTAPSHERVRDRLARVTLERVPGGMPLLDVADDRRDSACT